MIYIHHHLGLGDHIVCNAIVRKLYYEYGSVKLAVKEHNYSSVKQLYKDLQNVHYHIVKTDNDCISQYFKTPTIRIGFELCKPDWEKSFYDQVGMEYSERFSNFYIDRDFERETLLQNKLNLPCDFAFVNKAGSIGNKDIKVDTNLPIIELHPITDSIFDWIGVLEKAKEIHTIDSSIFQLAKQLNLNGKKLFYDVRKGNHKNNLDESWKII